MQYTTRSKSPPITKHLETSDTMHSQAVRKKEMPRILNCWNPDHEGWVGSGLQDLLIAMNMVMILMITQRQQTRPPALFWWWCW